MYLDFGNWQGSFRWFTDIKKFRLNICSREAGVSRIGQPHSAPLKEQPLRQRLVSYAGVTAALTSLCAPIFRGSGSWVWARDCTRPAKMMARRDPVFPTVELQFLCRCLLTDGTFIPVSPTCLVAFFCV